MFFKTYRTLAFTSSLQDTQGEGNKVKFWTGSGEETALDGLTIFVLEPSGVDSSLNQIEIHEI